MGNLANDLEGHWLPLWLGPPPCATLDPFSSPPHSGPPLSTLSHAPLAGCPDGRPHALRSHRHLDVLHPEVSEGVHHRVDHDRGRGGGRAFPASSQPQGGGRV